jgi:putative oxidoreductase
MASSKLVRILLLVLRVALGGVFVYAAWIKLRDPWQLFAMSIDSYRILPLGAVELAAHVIPWMELAVGLMLIAGLWLRISGSIVSLLLLTFFVLMLRAYAKGMAIDCGCFGPGEAISWKTLLRDGSMVAAALLLTTMAFLNRPKTAA